jgi:hypothetical protein
MSLASDEWFALMVTDHNPTRRKEDFCDYEKRWIGFEKTSDGRVYISKDYAKRHNLMRGETMVIKIDDTSNYCIL